MTGSIGALEYEKGSYKSSNPRWCFGLARWWNATDPSTRAAARAGALILTWYVLSTALNIYNKALVGKTSGVFGPGHPFPAPLLLASIQFAFQALLARATFGLGLVARTAGERQWSDWGRLVLPNGIITGMDIGFSNKSLVYITMSFYTMCKSTTPIFLLLWAFLWGLERPSWRLAGVVSVITGGLLLLVAGEAQFQVVGFTLVMTASCLAGLRFTITQLLLHGGHGVAAPLGGALEVIELLTPVMSVTTLLLSAGWEDLGHSLSGSPYFSTLRHMGITLGIILVGAVMAFLMVWTEYQVIKETSALTFMIAATFKEMLTVMAGVLVFGDTFGPINGVGLLVLILGVMLFNCYKMDKMKTEAAEGIKAGARSSSGGGGSVIGTGEGSFISSMSPRAGERGGQVIGRRGGSGRAVGVSSSSNSSSPGGALIGEDEEEGGAEGGEMAPLLLVAGSSSRSSLQRP